MLHKRRNYSIIIVTILTLLGVVMVHGSLLKDKDLAFIREVEGLRHEAYQDEGGVWTIGYGHTRDVKEGDHISTHKANMYLNTDIIIFEIQLQKLIRADLTKNQYTALLSLMYNIGTTQFADSTLLKYVNEGKLDLVPNEIRKWNKVNGEVSLGLTRRREKEANLFMSETKIGR